MPQKNRTMAFFGHFFHFKNIWKLKSTNESGNETRNIHQKITLNTT